MTYREEPGSLFDVPQGYTLVHCISRDCAMGAGIAKEFVKRFPDIRNVCQKHIRRNYNLPFIPYVELLYPNGGAHTKYITGRRVINLVTKDFYWLKPTYNSLENSLTLFADICSIDKLAMPKIGCGLDGLKWSKVNAIIQNVFKETDVEILIKTN